MPAILRMLYYQKLTKDVYIMSHKEILNLPLDSVKPNPYQPRRIFDLSGLEELASSIKLYGVLQPISVRLINNTSYELVAGERRLRASKIAGMTTVPAILIDINDMDSAVIALIENLQRKDLHFFEEAEGFLNLMGDYAFTQEALATRIGKNQSTIANKLRLLKLSRPVQKQIIENNLTERHARALLSLDREAVQLEVVNKIILGSLTVRKTEELISSLLKPTTEKTKAVVTPYKANMRDIRLLTNSIKENLEIVRKCGMEAEFDMQEIDNGYNITIKVCYSVQSA